MPVAPRTADRQIPGHRLGDKDMLWSWLRFARATVAAKAAGLSQDQIRARLAGFETTMAGILKHLVTSEQHWFANVLGGQDIPMPFHAGDPDGDRRVTDGDDFASMARAYEDACAASDQVIGAPELDSVGAQGAGDYTLRWALAHMAMETSRHLGHADLIRELLDGERGW